MTKRYFVLLLLFLNACYSYIPNSMFYTDAKTQIREEIEYKTDPNCHTEVYTSIMMPKESYYEIGTCKTDKEPIKRANYNNIQLLQACACAKGGDGIIIINFEEEIVKVETPMYFDQNGIFRSGSKRFKLYQEVVAKVIKYGKEEDLRY